VGDTQFKCISSIGNEVSGFDMGGGMMGDGGDGFGGFGKFGGFGEDDEFEGFGENENSGMIGGIQPAFGSLSCPAGERGSILVKRVTYGSSMFPGTCEPVPFCAVVHDSGESVASKCNGQNSCSVNYLQPKWLNCGQMSNYIRVEYECVSSKYMHVA